MKKTDSATHLTFDGPKEYSIFHSLIIWCATVPEGKERIERFKDLINHIKDLNDHRLLVIVGALVIENVIDDILCSFMPGYKDIKNKRDITFSIKIDILNGLRLIPSRIINNADFIRKIRNNFAHNLETKNFDQIEDKIFQSLEDRVNEYLVGDKTNDDIFENFNNLVLFTLIGLNSYHSQVSHLSNFIRNGKRFNKVFKEYCIEIGGYDPDKNKKKHNKGINTETSRGR